MKRNQFNVILLDLGLPDSSGLDTFSSLINHVNQIPVIVLTALDDIKIGQEALRNGAQDYLVKGSLHSYDLIKSIQTALMRKRMEETIRLLSPEMSSADETDILKEIVNVLSRTIQAEYAFVGEIIAPSNKTIRTAALSNQGSTIGNIEYELTDTPCENVAEKGLCIYPESIQSQFPNDKMLVKMGIESYAGIPLYSSDRSVIGLLVVLSVKPLENTAHVRSVLNAFALRAAAELERRISDRDLERKNLEQKKLLKVAQQLNSSLELDVVLNSIVYHTTELLRTKCSAIYYLDNDNQCLNPTSVYSLDEKYKAEIMSAKIPVENSLNGDVITTGKSIIFNDVGKTSKGYAIGTSYPDEHVMVSPLLIDGEITGSLWTFRRKESFNFNDQNLFDTFASLASTALTNAHVHNRMQSEIIRRKQAELSLRAEKVFIDTALDTQQDTFFLFDPSTSKALRWNRAFREISGYTDEEIARMPAPTSYYSPEDLKRAAIFIGNLLKEGKGKIDLELICKNGNKVPTEYMVSVVNDDQGEQKYAISIGRDITERKYAEIELLQSESLLRGVIDSVPNCVYVKDRNGRYILVNKKMADLHKTTPEALVGSTDVSLAKNWLTTNNSIESFRASEREVIDKKQSLTIQAEKFTYKDGRTRWFQTTKLPIAVKNDPECLLGVAADVTNLVVAQEKLLDSEKKFKNIFEYSREVIFITKADGTFIDLNQAGLDLFGYSRKEIYKINSKDLYVTLEDRIKILSQLESSGFVKDYEVQLKKKDGSVIDVVTTNAKQDFNGSREFLIHGILRDVSEQVKARKNIENALETLQKADQLKSNFITNISHEIRTPLNAIMGFTDLIHSNISDQISPELNKYFEVIQGSCDRLMNTVHSILDISQIEVGTVELNNERIDMVELITELIEEQRPKANSRTIVLKFSNNLKNPYIIADRYCVIQALSNLLDNAIKYTEQGKVTIGFKRSGKSLHVIIEDTGIGMSEEFLARLYRAIHAGK